MAEEIINRMFHFTLSIETNDHKKEKVILDKLHKYNARSDRMDRIRITTNKIEIIGDRIDEKSLSLDKYNQDTALFSEIKRCLLFLYFQNCEIKDDGKITLCYKKGTKINEQKNWKVSELLDLKCFDSKRPFEINNLEILFTCQQAENLFCSLMHCVLSLKEDEGKLNERWKALNALYKAKNKQFSDKKGIKSILDCIDDIGNESNGFSEFCIKNIDKFRQKVDVAYYLNKNETIQIYNKFNTDSSSNLFSVKRLKSIEEIVEDFPDTKLVNEIKKCIVENEKYLYDHTVKKFNTRFSSIIGTIDKTTEVNDFAFSKFFLKYIYQKRCESFHGSSIDYCFFKNDEKTNSENKVFNKFLFELITILFNSDYLKDSINLDLLKEIEE